jgi:hypothetical protein
MGGGEDHNLLPPDHVGDVVLAEPGLEVRPAHGSAPNVVEQRIGNDGSRVTLERRIEVEGE